MTATAAERTARAPAPQRERSPRFIQVQGVLTKELRDRMRGARAFVVLSVYLFLLSGFTLLIYGLVKLAASSSPTTPAGKIVFLGLAAFQLALVCFLAWLMVEELVSPLPAVCFASLSGGLKRSAALAMRSTSRT